jgi:hypothetical protein
MRSIWQLYTIAGGLIYGHRSGLPSGVVFPPFLRFTAVGMTTTHRISIACWALIPIPEELIFTC